MQLLMNMQYTPPYPACVGRNMSRLFLSAGCMTKLLQKQKSQAISAFKLLKKIFSKSEQRVLSLVIAWDSFQMP
jgi:hypothetical protein